MSVRTCSYSSRASQIKKTSLLFGTIQVPVVIRLPSLEPRLQPRRGPPGAFRPHDGGADGDPRCARGQYPLNVFLGDSADGEPGDVGRLGSGLHEGQAGELGLGELLGGAGKDGADTEVAGAGENRRVELGAVVGRDTDQQVGADDPAGVANREVVLADVDAVGSGQPRQVGAVIEDEAGLRSGGQDPDLASAREQLAVGKVFLAKLDDIGAAGQCLADDPGQVAQGRQAADQDHQLRFPQGAVSMHRGERELLERVNIVPQDLEPPGEPDIDELPVLFERAQGLGDALEIGGENGPGILANLLRGCHDVRADVLARVARADEQFGVKTAQSLGQAVANLLQPAGQAWIIEHEPGVILDVS